MHTNWCVLIEISMEIEMINFLIGIIGHCTDGRKLLYKQNWLKEDTEALVLKKTAASSK